MCVYFNKIKKEIKAIELKISEVEFKIAQLENRMTKKLYAVISGLAVFLTTVILGVLPHVLNAS